MFYNFKYKKMRLLYVFSSLVLILVLGSCNQFEINSYFKKVAIPHQEWKGEEPLVFEIDIKDVIAPYYYFLYLQHDDHYPYANFWCEISVFKEGDEVPIKTQRVEADLADSRGTWLGNGTQDIVQHKIPFAFKDGLEFEHAGVYRFEIKQLMRTDPLPMIGAGLLMEKGYKHSTSEDSVIEDEQAIEGITQVN